MNTITFDLGYRLENESIYKMVVAYSKHTYIKFLTRILLFIIQRLFSLLEFLVNNKIKQIKKLLIQLDMYGKSISNFSTEQINKDHRDIVKIIPVYENFYIYLKKNENFFEAYKELSITIKSLLNSLESIEATLEIYSNPKDVQDLNTAINDFEIGNLDAYTEWNPSAI